MATLPLISIRVLLSSNEPSRTVFSSTLKSLWIVIAPPTVRPPPTLTSKLTVSLSSIVVAPSTSKVPSRSVLESTLRYYEL